MKYLLLLLMPILSYAGCLDSQYQVKRPPVTTSYNCPALIEPHTGILDMPSKYQDDDSEQVYKSMTKRIKDFQLAVTKASDAYWYSSELNTQAKECLEQHITSWSAVGAMTAEATTPTGKAVRKWYLSSVAIALTKTRVPDSDSWIKTLADKVIEENDYYFVETRKINNHLYWSALAVFYAGTILNNDEYKDWSHKAVKAAADSVDSHGYLPTELARGERAIEYHSFAATPLFMLANELNRSGYETWSLNDNALARIGARLMKSIEHPGEVESATMKEQKMDKIKKNYFLTWLESYSQRYPLTEYMKSLACQEFPTRSTYAGGYYQ